MTRNQKKIQVVKVPLKGFPTNKPQIFPRMPRLYLELMENKAKIRQDLINKEHISTSHEATNHEATNHKQSIDIDSDNDSDNSRSGFPKGGDKVKQKSKFEDRLDMLLSDSSDSSDSDSDTVSSKSSISALSIEENKRDDDVKTNDSDNLSIRLKELLKDDDSCSESTINPVSRSGSDKYSKNRDKHGHSVTRYNRDGGDTTRGGGVVPPTLAELEARGGYIPRRELRDINQQPEYNQQQDEDSKRELLFKFDLLRKSYPASTIPEYSIHTDLSTMEKSYSDCVRRLSLDSSVDSYKTYLVYGFMGCEFLFGNFLGFDMQGFTQQQIISMNSYEKMLIELGEKSYVPSGSKWPVELRLLFMIIMNAAFFVISKMMMKKTGANLMGMINGMNTNTTTPAQKRKMRGPNVDLSDLPDI